MTRILYSSIVSPQYFKRDLRCYAKNGMGYQAYLAVPLKFSRSVDNKNIRPKFLCLLHASARQ